MYSLVQDGIIAHDALTEHLKPYVYAPAKITQGIWTQIDRGINFTLLVDYFGIKYIRKNDAYHLILALQAKYEVTQYWKGGL